MTTAFNPRPSLNSLSDALTLGVMLALTAASAAAVAQGLPESSIPALPTVVVTAKAAPAAIPRLPTVIVVGKRASA